MSTVPAVCRIGADRRLLPGESAARCWPSCVTASRNCGWSGRACGSRSRCRWTCPASRRPPITPLVGTADAALRAAGGPGLPLGGWTAACDGGFVARDLGVPAVVLGPGSVTEQAHRSDESVGVAELVVAARAYALTALRLLG